MTRMDSMTMEMATAAKNTADQRDSGGIVGDNDDRNHRRGGASFALNRLGGVPAGTDAAAAMGVQFPAEVNDPNDPNDLSPRQVVAVLRQIALHFFPLLRSDTSARR